LVGVVLEMGKCFVCGEALSGPNLNLLQCLHSMHSECVDHLIAQQAHHTTEWLKCGECGTQTKLNNPQQQNASLPRLPINPFIGSLINININNNNNNNGSSNGGDARQELECGECDEEEHIEALFRCINCDVLMCEDHSNIHQKSRATKSHQVEAIKKVRELHCIEY